MRDSLVWYLFNRRESTTHKQLLLFDTTGSPCALPTRTNHAPTPRCLKTAFCHGKCKWTAPASPSPALAAEKSCYISAPRCPEHKPLAFFSHLTAQLLRAQVKPCGAERSNAPEESEHPGATVKSASNRRAAKHPHAWRAPQTRFGLW